ncbi:AarF/ABC1/UbiB kinase family protein [Geobacter sp. DSM 9736]|uniref:ABC1 kinase family protein n=1 Tax=Geobacter sp. DSM 9736 TaxID=1277350 RepID=UPI000B50E3BE|nr:AarF/ABC1/UbiB kinase family protein [Geobacter sp. DSM 9736]SNB46749.1 Predicted unusual protein kinase regulating ubiquinone biosynthesis, AarF/ABC1/UbiB family [Geobacter sp. DSM 9736]
MQCESPSAKDRHEMRMLLDILPKDRIADPTGVRLAELVSSVSNKKVPVSSFPRIWSLGTLHARITLGYLAYWLRSRFASAGEKQRLRNEVHLAAALQLVGTMGYLRGAVMKVGQMLANLPEVLPEEFAETLSFLHFQAPPMHFAMVREVFLDEFGREPEEVYSSFDRQAFAAASLGQVHRARLKSGEEVAVKIQYPGIARTITTDMLNLRMLLQPIRVSEDWSNLLDKLADIEQMLLMETDYVQEARFIAQARDLFSPDDGVVIPRVYKDYSTGRVLTTEYLPGLHLNDFLASKPDQSLRDRYTHLLTAATMRLLYRSHWLLADPNPGNFIFMEGGRLGIIDFGCTRAITDEEWSLQHEVENAVLKRDEPEMERLVVKASLYDTAEQMGAERLEVVGRAIRWQMEPWLTEGLFDFGDRDFFRRGMEALMDVTRKRCTRGMPVHIWSTRFILGARAIVYRLKGRCDFRKIYEQESAIQIAAVNPSEES